jgi:hypothetical protein
MESIPPLRLSDGRDVGGTGSSRHSGRAASLRRGRAFDTLAVRNPPMRQFLWGAVWGAVAVYLYATYGDQLHRFKRYIDNGRDWAVEQSDGYATGRDKKK